MSITVKRGDIALIEYYAQQKECFDWINSVLVEEPLQSGDLSKELHSGVVLIKLLNTFFPGLLPKYHRETATTLKLVENVELFLTACDRLGLNYNGTLFTALDLFEANNMNKVFTSLFRLAELLSSKGFPTTWKKTPKLEKLETLTLFQTGKLTITDLQKQAVVMCGIPLSTIEKELELENDSDDDTEPESESEPETQSNINNKTQIEEISQKENVEKDKTENPQIKENPKIIKKENTENPQIKENTENPEKQNTDNPQKENTENSQIKENTENPEKENTEIIKNEETKQTTEELKLEEVKNEQISVDEQNIEQISASVSDLNLSPDIRDTRDEIQDETKPEKNSDENNDNTNTKLEQDLDVSQPSNSHNEAPKTAPALPASEEETLSLSTRYTFINSDNDSSDDISKSFLALMRTPTALEYFRLFLRKEFSLENLRYYEQVNDFRASKKKPEYLKREGEFIFAKFIYPAQDGFQINLPAPLTKNLKDHLDQETIETNVFLESQHHVFRLMEVDSYPRFLVSSFYAQCAEDIKPLNWDEALELYGKEFSEKNQRMATAQKKLSSRQRKKQKRRMSKKKGHQ